MLTTGARWRNINVPGEQELKNKEEELELTLQKKMQEERAQLTEQIKKQEQERNELKENVILNADLLIALNHTWICRL